MNKIKTGNVEIGTDEFNPKKGKFRVNMFMDLDIVDEIRKRASAEHMPYQTWINRKLREIIENQSVHISLTEKDVVRIVDKRLEKRINKKVLKRA